NYAHKANEAIKQIGGAMDLAVGARRLWVIMEHTTKSGAPRLKRRCDYPLTAKGTVRRVYTNLAVLDVTPRGFVVRDMVAGLSLAELQTRTDAALLAD
ncbi:MAG: CoA-transferase, partial [Acetobacteraceae bacterium]